MAKRGRKSAAEMQIARLSSTIEAVHRPDAPYELTDDQALIWRRLADDLPADWFTPKHTGLLKQYCRHEAQSDRIAQLVEQEMSKKELDIANYDKLLAMQEREGRAMSSLATRMRITHQALYDKSTKAQSRQVSKPWEFSE